MYHLLKGAHEYLTRKEEFSVIIIGLDGAGKTTLLERIKTLYNETPGLTPDKIAPTVGQNTGKITLPSTILQFWDLGGQRGIRNIWHRYYDDCHAVAYVIDAEDRERLSEGWEVFDSVLSAPQILHIPPPPHRQQAGLPERALRRGDPPRLRGLAPKEDGERASERAIRARRGRAEGRGSRVWMLWGLARLRAAVDWLFIRVQNSRRDPQKGIGS
ncbi:hypothetical protein MVEN_00826200 [Mycena venus]|uniref:P-loop containing nucleoside triphosphate hydrolase protein n=1 Tax=Mycena venus TaxID=2733690 RepID=A0A8H6YFW8_9AGAR|nr:hypothetical protein MVEN_00826200 [Mycena venus]